MKREFEGMWELMEEVSPGFILDDKIPDSGLCILYGPSGVGKSFLAIDFALRTSENYPVLYVAAERGGGIGARLRSWIDRYSREIEPGTLKFVRRGIPNLNRGDDVNDFIEELDENYKLIIFDTLAACIPGAEENSASDMGVAVSNCNAIMRKIGGTVMLVHHSGKDGNRGMRGSSALHAAADTIIKVSKTKVKHRINVSCEKSSDRVSFMPYSVALEAENESRVPVFVGDLAITEKQYQVLAALLDMPDQSGGVSDVANILGIGRNNAGSVLKALLNYGYVTQDGRNKKYTLHDSGEGVLQ